jgi:hypothetical protein
MSASLTERPSPPGSKLPFKGTFNSSTAIALVNEHTTLSRNISDSVAIAIGLA